VKIQSAAAPVALERTQYERMRVFCVGDVTKRLGKRKVTTRGDE